MKDNYGREVNSLRLSITQRCNLSCFYCHNEGQEKNTQELSPAEIEAIAKAASSLGISKLKVTGGEPLLRADVAHIVERASQYMSETSLTTNGVRLLEYTHQLKRAGLSRINASLPSIDADTYRRITGKPYQSQVIQGIQKAASEGFGLLKINTVLLKGVNEGEVDQLAQFCFENRAILQLIELEVPKEQVGGGFYQQYHFDLTSLENELGRRAIQTITRKLHHRKQYVLPWNKGEVTIEIVKPMHNTEFCQNCSRIRVTSGGGIKTCLWSKNGLVNIAGLTRPEDQPKLEQSFITAIRNRKPYYRAVQETVL